MPKLYCYKHGPPESGMANYYAKANYGGNAYDLWSFYSAAEPELRERHQSVGERGDVSLDWLLSLKARGLRWPTKGEGRREFEMPSEPLPDEKLPGLDLPDWPGETPVLCLRAGDHRLCLRLPMLPAAWRETASIADRNELKSSDARFELGDVSVLVRRLRFGPHDLPVSEWLVERPIEPTLHGHCPASLDLRGHLLPNAGIVDGFAMFRPIEAGGARLTERSAAPGDALLILHRANHPVVKRLQSLRAASTVAAHFERRWLVSQVTLPDAETTAFHEALTLLGLQPAARRWGLDLLQPAPLAVTANGLHVAPARQRLLVRLRQRQRKGFNQESLPKAQLTWVGGSSPTSKRHQLRSYDEIVEIAPPGTGRWDLWVHGGDAIEAVLSFRFVAEQDARLWSCVAPLAVTSCWNGLIVESEAWMPPTSIEVPHSVGDALEVAFDPPRIPAGLPIRRRLAIGASRASWTDERDIAEDLAEALRRRERVTLELDAGAYGSVSIPVVPAGRAADSPHARRGNDPLAQWLNAIGRGERTRTMARVIRTARGR